MVTRYGFALVLMALASLALAGGPGPDSAKMIVGLHEKVHIQELGLSLPAKLDTGAESASLSADNIRIVSRQGGEVVTFDLALNEQTRKELAIDNEQLRHLELPLVDHVRIKRRAENLLDDGKSYTRRPRVMLTLCVGNRPANVEVNLTDRRDFSYPLLVGSEALRSLGAVVDPAVSMGKGSPDCGGESPGPTAE